MLTSLPCQILINRCSQITFTEEPMNAKRSIDKLQPWLSHSENTFIGVVSCMDGGPRYTKHLHDCMINKAICVHCVGHMPWHRWHHGNSALIISDGVKARAPKAIGIKTKAKAVVHKAKAHKAKDRVINRDHLLRPTSRPWWTNTISFSMT